MTREQQPIPSNEISQPTDLTDRAQSYLDQLGQRRQELKTLRLLVRKNHLSADILERRQVEFNNLAILPHEDLELQRGINLLRDRQEQQKSISPRTEEEQREKPRLVFFGDSSQIELDGRRINLTPDQLKVLQVLAKNINQQIPTRQLSYEALGNIDPVKTGLRGFINLLKKKITTPTAGELVVASGPKAQHSWYMLKEVDAVWYDQPEPSLAEPPSEEKKPREFPPPLHQSRIDALLIMILDAESIDEIRQALGPARSGRQLTDQQVSWALIGSINKLYARVKKDIANAAELEIWETIRKEADMQNDEAILDFARESIKSWIKGIDLPTPDWDLIFGPLSSQEALVLTLVLEYNQDLLEKYQLPKLPQELSEKIKAGIPILPSFSEEELNQLRVNSLRKVRDIIRGEKFDKIYDLQDPEIQTLLIYFMEVDSQGAFDLIEELLKIPDRDAKDQLERIKRQLVDTDLRTIREVRQTPTLPYIRKSLILDTEESEQATSQSQGIQASVPLPYEPPVEKPRITQVEQRDTEVRQRINSFLDRITELGITRSINGPQLTRFFPRVKRNFFEQAVERGYINPERGRDHHPVYKVEEIIVLLYIREYGNNLTSRQVKELREIIEEEMGKREKENGNSSGK